MLTRAVLRKLPAALLFLAAATVPARAQQEKEVREGPELLIERMKWFRAGRLGPQGRIPWNARVEALRQLDSNLENDILAAPSAIPADQWVSIGPSPAQGGGSFPHAGRVTALLPVLGGPAANWTFAGSAQGGVWYNTNIHGGANWGNTDALWLNAPSMAVGAIALGPSTDPAQAMYVGTGEPNLSCDSYFGAGIIKSLNYGATISVVGQATFGGTSVSRIVVHPTTSNTVWAANTGGSGGFACTGPGGTYGVFRSADGGTNWTQQLGQTQIGANANVNDLVSQPGSSSVLYAAVEGSGVWKTTDGGTSWTKLAGGFPTTDLGRIDLAIHPSSTSTLYAVIERKSNGRLLGVYKTTNAGTSWSPTSSPAAGGDCQGFTLDDICTYQGSGAGTCWYNLVVEVAPDGGVWLGGIGLWRSGDGGSTWSDVCSGDVHVDQHAIAFSGDYVFVGNDGGVVVTADDGSTWTTRNNNLRISQFYPGASLHTANPARALGGTQDNGTRWLYGAYDTWAQVFGGDGGFTAMDPASPDTDWYVSTQNLKIWRTTDGGTSFAPAMFGIDDSTAAFIAPFAMCPSSSSVLAAGTTAMWRTTNGGVSWTLNSSNPLDVFCNPALCPPGPYANCCPKIRALAFAPSDTTCLTYYAALDNGAVYRTTDGGTTWTNITTVTLPERAINDLAVHPTDANTVYAAYSGFGASHLYRSTNAAGVSPTWAATDTGIPNTPVNAVLLDPTDPTNVVYIGTDIGVFRSTDGGTSWSPFMTYHPKVAVFDLVADASTGIIVSFTHGAGAFQTPACAIPPFGGVDSVADVDACTTGGGIRVQWPPPASWGGPGTDGSYEIRRFTDSSCAGGYTTVASNLPSWQPTSFDDTTAVAGQTYHYQVVATSFCFPTPRSTVGIVSCSGPVADDTDVAPCADVGNTLLLGKGSGTADLSWGSVPCSDLAGYPIYGASSYAAPFPGGWTLLGSPASTGHSDAWGSPYVAYRVVAEDACGNRSAD